MQFDMMKHGSPANATMHVRASEHKWFVQRCAGLWWPVHNMCQFVVEHREILQSSHV